MAVPTGVNAGEQDAAKGVDKWRSRLGGLVGDWNDIRSTIADIIDQLETLPETAYTERKRADLRERLENLRKRREGIVNNIQTIVTARPKLRDDAIDLGFRADLLPGGGGSDGGGNAGTPSGSNAGEAKAGGGTPIPKDQGGGGGGGDTGGGGGGGGGGGANARAQAIDNRLLGDKGKDYDIVRGPKGSYVARYKFTIDGETFHIGVRIPRDQLSRYGVKEGEGKQLTAAQMKRIKNIGSAEALAPHMRKGDSHVLKSLVRSLNTQYEGQSILNNDGVMSKVIANSLFGWNAAEFENQLRTTKWYKNTNAYQREYVTTVSPEEKKERSKLYMERVVNKLEDMYGLDWTKHVKGGMQQARKWADIISSGRWGEPGEGFEFWAERQFDRAAAIEGTNAFISRQQEEEERRAYLNRPEDVFEQKRQEAMAYLGYDKNNTPRIARSDLQMWANQLVSGEKSEGDWAQFLRNTMKTLHPYFDPNLSFTEQASPYKSVAERIMGDTLDWNDKLLMDFTRTKADGTPTDRPMSLRDYELKVRSDNRAWKQGTQLFEEGLGIVQALESVFKGVG